jgi:Siphovirus ReqiPepy6 Gp37-like protein
LTDDTGKRIALLNSLFEGLGYFSYSRATKGYGTCLIGIPFENYKEKVFPLFQPDWRVDIWRSPETGFPMQHEQTYLLRMPKIYTRDTDNVQIIALYGRDAKDLLRRRWVIQPAGYSQTYKTDYIDDMMKEIVREQMLWGQAVDADGVQDNTRAFPVGEFKVQGNNSLGPLYTHTFADRNVLDVLRELRDASFQKYSEDPLSYSRIYFDVRTYQIEGKIIYILDEETGDPILDEDGYPLIAEASPDSASIQGFEFLTLADLYGKDRTGDGLVFSIENNNLQAPYYTKNYMEEENSIIVKGFGRGDSRPHATVTDTQRAAASRWNLCEGFQDASTEPDQTYLDNYAYPTLYAGQPSEDIGAVFLSTPGSEDTPRSLYGIDWDLGDLLAVEYAGMRFTVEVEIVYAAIDENGKETITGRSNVSAGD